MEFKVIQGIVKVEKLDEFLSKYGKKAVFLDANYIIDENQVYFAVKKAIDSWKKGRNVAKSLPLEVLLYVAATRQIKDATKLGIREGINEVVCVLFEKDFKIENFEEKEVLKIDDEEKIKRISEFYKIPKEELNLVGVNKLPLLVRERIILFDIEK